MKFRKTECFILSKHHYNNNTKKVMKKSLFILHTGLNRLPDKNWLFVQTD